MNKLVLLFIISCFYINVKGQQATVIDHMSMTVPRYADLVAIQAAIYTPQAGMMVYNIATQSNWNYNGTAWVNTAGAGQWITNGDYISYGDTAQTFSVISNSIVPNNSTSHSSSLTVTKTGIITDANSVLIFMRLDHQWVGRIRIILESPTGEEIYLFSLPGSAFDVQPQSFSGWTSSFVSTNKISFNNRAFGPIEEVVFGNLPSGTFLSTGGPNYPATPLTALNGLSINGTWKLKVHDFYSEGPAGMLVEWGMTFLGKRVGIGTNTPSSEFEVKGEIKSDKVFSNNLKAQNISGNKIGIGLDTPNSPLQFSNNLSRRKIVLKEFLDNDHQFFGFGNTDLELTYQVGNNYNDHVFYSGINLSGSKELMRIKGDGKVGIGVSLPDYNLDVLGNIRIKKNNGTNESAGIWFNTNNNANLNTFIGINDSNNFGVFSSQLNRNVVISDMSNGFLGIDVESPHAPIHLKSNVSNKKIVLFEGVNNDHQFYGFGVNSNGVTGSLRYQVNTLTDDHVFFAGENANSSLELMRVKGNGNIGLGTNNPQSTLDIEGSFGTKLYKSNNSGSIIIDNSASVWYFTQNQTISLPNPNTCENRRYTIVNAGIYNISFGSNSYDGYMAFGGFINNSIQAASSIEIISDGFNWLQIK